LDETGQNRDRDREDSHNVNQQLEPQPRGVRPDRHADLDRSMRDVCRHSRLGVTALIG
jgi:hypothetical protein